MGYLVIIFPIAALAFGGWLFTSQIIPQIQRALGA